MLGEAAADRVPITVLGAGRSLVGDSMTVDLTRDDVEAALHEFLPLTQADEESRGRDRRAGLRELGLPYETDPAITRHLAAFLARSATVFAPDHRAWCLTAGRPMIRPDLVLFNGGFFTPAVARERVAQALAGWFGKTPRLLATGNLEAAVAIGAATYARLRAGIGRPGPLVKAGSGRAYYIAVGGRSGAASDLGGLRARARDRGGDRTAPRSSVHRRSRIVPCPSRSTARRRDRIAPATSSLSIPDEDAREHAPLVTVFRYGRKSRHVELPVRLSVAFTEVGTLEIWCRSETTEHRWRLQFQVRSAEEETDRNGERDVRG